MELLQNVPVSLDGGSQGELLEQVFERWISDDSKLWLYTHGRIGDRCFRQFGWTGSDLRQRRLEYVAFLDSDAVSGALSGARKVNVVEMQEVAFERNGKRPRIRLSISRTFSVNERRFRVTEMWCFTMKSPIERLASRLAQAPRNVNAEGQQQRLVSIQVSVPLAVEVERLEGELPNKKAESNVSTASIDEAVLRNVVLDTTDMHEIASFWGRRAQQRIEIVRAYETFCTETSARSGSGDQIGWQHLLPENPARRDLVEVIKSLKNDLALTQERLRFAEGLLDRAQERERSDAARLAVVLAERDGYRKAVDFARNYIEMEDQGTSRRQPAKENGKGSVNGGEEFGLDASVRWRPVMQAPASDSDARWQTTYGEKEWLYYDLP